MLSLKETNEVNNEASEQDRLVKLFIKDETVSVIKNSLEEFEESPFFVIKSKIGDKVLYQFETNNYKQAELLLKKIS